MHHTAAIGRMAGRLCQKRTLVRIRDRVAVNLRHINLRHTPWGGKSRQIGDGGSDQGDLQSITQNQALPIPFPGEQTTGGCPRRRPGIAIIEKRYRYYLCFRFHGVAAPRSRSTEDWERTQKPTGAVGGTAESKGRARGAPQVGPGPSCLFTRVTVCCFCWHRISSRQHQQTKRLWIWSSSVLLPIEAGSTPH